MIKPTLLVLAAGMGSRYGSLKQMDGVGPGNEAIIDYSVYDAIRAGFGKVVFVIRHSFASDFQEVFTEERFGGRIRVEYVYQELDCLPEGFTVPEGRVKPWGTNHAILVARDAVHEPFAVINADDFYGAEAFRTIAEYLRGLDGASGRYCMVAYELSRTLSENGTVSRGVCSVNAAGIAARRHAQVLVRPIALHRHFQPQRRNGQRADVLVPIDLLARHFDSRHALVELARRRGRGCRRWFGGRGRFGRLRRFGGFRRHGRFGDFRRARRI